MLHQPELAQRAQARVGTTIGGKYRIDAVLGIGGMAVVYAATHRNRAEFAIKMLHPELSLREDMRTRFLREGYTANSVKHPGAVRVVDDDIAEDGAAFLVMELLRGVVVEALLENASGRLGPAAAAAIVIQLLDVLSAAHGKGIIHRDIKPANLFLTTDGTVKVLDFGIARAKEMLGADASGASMTSTGMLLGTPAFMAPEQAQAQSADIDAQTDVWAAAATLFTLLSGQWVHRGNNAAQLLISAATTHPRPLSSVAAEVPAAIAQVVDRGLAFDKSVRWSSARAMQQALDAACRSAFAEQASTAHLAALALSPGGSATATATAQAWTPPSKPWPAAGAAATPEPVASRKSQAFPKRFPVLLVAAAGGAVILLGAILLAARHWADGSAGVHAQPSIEASAAGSRAVAERPQPPVPELAAPVESSTDRATLSQPLANGQDAAPIMRATASSRGAARPPPVAAPARPISSHGAANCDPPFVIDAAGHRVPKPECL
jgi:serine/threonine-protein kinase